MGQEYPKNILWSNRNTDENDRDKLRSEKWFNIWVNSAIRTRYTTNVNQNYKCWLGYCPVNGSLLYCNYMNIAKNSL